MITPEKLSQIVKTKYPKVLADAINDTCLRYEINTPLRLRHFLSQVLHESGGFIYSKEIASGSAYEFRKDLGNVQGGWGRKYKGRGFIQITGRFNYELLSKSFSIDFINKPELLEQLPYSMLSAGWFWHIKGLNKLADKNDIIGITKKINGGLNGLSDRKLWFEKLAIL